MTGMNVVMAQSWHAGSVLVELSVSVQELAVNNM